MTKEDLLSKLSEIGKDRHWLAAASKYDYRTVNNKLGPSGVISDRMMDAFETAIEQEEKSQTQNPSLPDRLSVEAKPEDLALWTKAFKQSDAETLEEWMVNAINEEAEEWHAAQQIKKFPDPTPNNVNDATFLVRGAVAAGAQMDHVSEHVVPVEYKRPAANYGLVVCGQSMEPEIEDGSIIEVEPLEGRTPRRGSIVVYSDGYGSSLKRLQLRKAEPGEEEFADRMGNIKVLESINPEFTDVEVMENGKLDAKFVGIIKPLSS